MNRDQSRQLARWEVETDLIGAVLFFCIARFSVRGSMAAARDKNRHTSRSSITSIILLG